VAPLDFGLDGLGELLGSGELLDGELAESG
jgi:hypothetical protein